MKAIYKGHKKGSSGLNQIEEDYNELIVGNVYEIEYETGPNEESYIAIEGFEHWNYGFHYWTLDDLFSEWYVFQDVYSGIEGEALGQIIGLVYGE